MAWSATYPKDAPRDRLGLTNWVVSSENPLTARVTVNRVWQELLLVSSPRVTTLAPLVRSRRTRSVPDGLVVAFVENGWQLKRLYKTDVPTYALTADLKQRGLLDDTLVD